MKDDLREEEPELDRAEDRAEVELRIEPGECDLGEPECYYFEEYEAPRMNPSVVAATRGLDFSKSSTNGKGKPLRRCKSPWTRWRRQHAEKEEELPRPDAPARPPDSIESKQRKLNSIELSRVRSPSSRTLGSSTIPAYQEPSQSWNPYGQYELANAPPRPRKPHHFEMKKRRKRSRKLDRVRATPVAWSAPDGRLPSPDHDLVSQFFGGH
ncbi:unnamed protein product [Microthlaspi erraticum]|uniref:Uncharacterized protein n=1 Tax=Microthlaspi erraticum TaxID=1685480 RepID=A0A6D2IM86_9BRAS|nr:unnamed protein product [Microthlaspi erraticum]